MAARTWLIEISGGNAEDHLIYLVRLNDQEAKHLSDDLSGFVRNEKISTFKMDPADEVSISLEDVRRRLGLGR